jgi:hypothetical protein
LRKGCGLKFFLISLLAVLPGVVSAADLEALAKSPSWQALLHYPVQGGDSYVDDSRFFLNHRGHLDPVAELRATIAAVAEDKQTVCRFPDRYLWLKKHTLMPHWDLSHCDDYQQWRQGLNIDRVVLVFASSFLNSPSSMYGHTFLRLDPAGERQQSAFLSYALNFGASIPANENGMLYAYRGLFGGYPGLFTMQPYYEKIQEYTRLENRDMWEYELNLNSEEIDRLLAHTWALRDINFAYYFFDENCSFRLLELLEVARPGVDLSSPFEYAAMPVDTVRQLVTAGMVDDVAFRASRYRELSALLETMSAKERALVLTLADDPGQQSSKEFVAMDPQRQAHVIKAAYRYLRYRSNKQQRSPQTAKNSMALLRASKNAVALDKVAITTPSRSDAGHDTSLLGISGGMLDDQAFTDLEWRISYHDALDGKAGYPKGASLTMGELTLRWQEAEDVDLASFVPVAIRSLSPRDDFFSPLSWQVSGGVERLFDAPNQPLVSQINGGAGGSWRHLGGLAYSLLSARFEYNDEARESWRLAPGLRVGQLWQGEVFAAEIAAEVFEFWGDGLRKSVGVSGHWQYLRNQALRGSVNYRDRAWGESLEVSLSWRHYF